jgi:septal ring factor EnvC (AmiA/AmiB activator)
VTGEQPTELEGVRAWIAQLDRKLGTRTYAGAALLVLTLAAAIVALVLAIDARDNSASKSDLDQVRQELSGVAEQAGEAGDLESSLDSVTDRLDTLEKQVGDLESSDSDRSDQIGVIEDDIEDLRQQISDLESGGTGTTDSTGGTGAGG